MLNAALFALGILGFKCAEHKSSRDEANAAYFASLAENQRIEESIRRGKFNLAIQYTCREIIDSFDLQSNDRHICYAGSRGLYNVILSTKLAMVYGFSHEECNMMTDTILEKLGMTDEQYLVWCANAMNPLGECTFGTHEYKGKYYLFYDVDAKIKYRFRMADQVLLEVKDTPAVIKTAKQYGTMDQPKQNHIIADCGCPLEEFIAAHPVQDVLDILRKEV